MKLEDLCNCSADVLEPLVNNQEELDKICMPYWNVTRPELALKEVRVAAPVKQLTKEEIEKAKRIEKAKTMFALISSNTDLLNKFNKK